ncbi:MAG: response regulator [Elusimicrobiota bacterium]|nr:response regulator [Elusimicrobiota bacterium]
METPSKKNILIADDDPHIKNLLLEILENESYNFKTAENSVEIFRELGQRKYNLIILDISLPDATGYEISKKIIKNISTRPKILLFTIRNIANEKKLFKESGADAIIEKTIGTDEIKETVNKLLKEHSSVPMANDKISFGKHSYLISEHPKVDLSELRSQVGNIANNFVRTDQQHKWLVRDFLEEKQKTIKHHSTIENLNREIKKIKTVFYITLAFIIFILFGILLK